jgi:HD-GYP domain-containing protein (c-di-GMP phosphodiesterase class II)
MLQRGVVQDGNGSLLAATVEALAGTLGLRDGGTGSHCDRVAELASRLGRRLELPADALDDLVSAARVHDIGKVGVPDAVLRKPASLLPSEWKLMTGHCAWGAELLGRIPGLERVGLIVRHHHERFDGSGYPDGLAGHEIPLESRILGVADAYVAMSETRPYRPRLADDELTHELSEGCGSQFDPAVVEALLLELEDHQLAHSA